MIYFFMFSNLPFAFHVYRTSGMNGSITINGFERNLSQFGKLSCYIMQDNQLHGNLTVEEAMKVATALKLSSTLSRRHKEEVVCTIYRIGLDFLMKIFQMFLSKLHT